MLILVIMHENLHILSFDFQNKHLEVVPLSLETRASHLREFKPAPAATTHQPPPLGHCFLLQMLPELVVVPSLREDSFKGQASRELLSTH